MLLQHYIFKKYCRQKPLDLEHGNVLHGEKILGISEPIDSIETEKWLLNFETIKWTFYISEETEENYQ